MFPSKCRILCKFLKIIPYHHLSFRRMAPGRRSGCRLRHCPILRPGILDHKLLPFGCQAQKSDKSNFRCFFLIILLTSGSRRRKKNTDFRLKGRKNARRGLFLPAPSPAYHWRVPLSREKNKKSRRIPALTKMCVTVPILTKRPAERGSGPGLASL